MCYLLSPRHIILTQENETDLLGISYPTGILTFTKHLVIFLHARPPFGMTVLNFIKASALMQVIRIPSDSCGGQSYIWQAAQGMVWLAVAPRTLNPVRGNMYMQN